MGSMTLMMALMREDYFRRGKMDLTQMKKAKFSKCARPWSAHGLHPHRGPQGLQNTLVVSILHFRTHTPLLSFARDLPIRNM